MPILAVADLLTLAPGWDSYSAPAIDGRSARRAINIIVEFMRPGMPVPHVVPTVHGGIQLEWHDDGIDIEIYIDNKTDVDVLVEYEKGTIQMPLGGNEDKLHIFLDLASHLYRLRT
jgi:hypothetical protein